MLRRPHTFECECSLCGDQSTVTDPVGDSVTIDVAGTNSDAGTAEESDDVEHDSSCDDWRYGSEWDEDDESGYESEMWGRVGGLNNECPGFWDDDDDDETSEDEDSNQGSSQQDVSKVPSMKRAKTTHAVAPSPSKNIRRKVSLSLLPTMPLDVLFEIFSHLSPMDIINLSHSSKVFHETLSSQNTPAVWKAVRKRFSAPDGPDWMSEEAWVELLFGTNCRSCGKRYTDEVKVDFLLLKRICTPCIKKHYVSRSKVESLYPDFDFVVLLVPSTNNLPWNTWNNHKYFYLESDLGSMVNKLAALKQDADAQLLHCFMEERKRRLQCIRQNSSSWREWYARMILDRAQENRDADKMRLQQIKDKFKELGYDDEDLRILCYRKECRGPGKIQMTTKIWNRIRPILEPRVKEEKAQRLERQLGTTKCKRRLVLAARYKDFQRTLHPSQWKYLPRTLEIAAFEGFSQHIEAGIGVEVDETTFDDTFLKFPEILAAATEQRKTTMRALIPDTEFEDGEIGGDSIDLATAAFKCIEAAPRQFHYVFGWDEIASHHCLPEMEGIDYLNYHPFRTPRTAPLELKYIPEVAIIVRKLAQIIGLDAATATAADFDEKDKRFACEGCPRVRKEKGQYLQNGYTWRSLAAHLETSKHNPNFFISVLSRNAENEVKQCERDDQKWAGNQWTCSHCPEYLDDFQTRQKIVEHLSDSHGIRAPSEPTDLFFFERYKRDFTTQPKFSAPATNFKCLVCVLNKTRLFSLKGVEDHLRAKHKVTSAQNGVHVALA